jgi:lysophospholipase L1-like esterase
MTARNGATGSGAQLPNPVRYVAIGDSVAQGFRPLPPRPRRRDGCGFRIAGVPLWWFDDRASAYPALLGDVLGRRGIPLRLAALGTCSGLRTDHLWADGGPTPRLRALASVPADLVTLTVGANDVLPLWYPYLVGTVPLRLLGPLTPHRPVDALGRRLAPSRQQVAELELGLGQRLHRIVAWLSQRMPDAMIVLTTYFSGDGTVLARERFERSIAATIAGAAADHPMASVVDLGPVIDRARANGGPKPIALDALHPTPYGHLLIAEAIATEVARGIARGSGAGGLGERDEPVERLGGPGGNGREPGGLVLGDVETDAQRAAGVSRFERPVVDDVGRHSGDA